MLIICIEIYTNHHLLHISIHIVFDTSTGRAGRGIASEGAAGMQSKLLIHPLRQPPVNKGTAKRICLQWMYKLKKSKYTRSYEKNIEMATALCYNL